MNNYLLYTHAHKIEKKMWEICAKNKKWYIDEEWIKLNAERKELYKKIFGLNKK